MKRQGFKCPICHRWILRDELTARSGTMHQRCVEHEPQEMNIDQIAEESAKQLLHIGAAGDEHNASIIKAAIEKAMQTQNETRWLSEKETE